MNWNGEKVIKQCLNSVLAIDYPNYTALVIDNDSSDGSGEIVKNKYPNIEYLQLTENYGFSGGYNRCFKYLKDKDSEYILLLNNDTEVDPDILNNFIQAVGHYGKKNIFGGKIFYYNKPQLIWYAGGKVNLKFGRISHCGIRELDSEEYCLPMETDYITGCCMFTSREIIDQLNGFDERFNMYGEDVDLCMRAKRIGINCYYWPDEILWHHVSASMKGSLVIKKYYLKLVAMIWLILKNIRK